MATDTMQRPSFFESVKEGAKGWIKGALAGGSVGAVTGGIIGFLVTLGNPFGALAGAVALGGLFSTIGATAGTVTGVVRSREARIPSTQDMLNLANITYAQGVATGQQLEQAKGGYADKIAAERNNPSQKTR